ncbi:putative membrane transporter protein [Hyella patelloides LEGE 07179]|uniref:Probable membrane transporter protein n=1 Tax=Hyella patelloides LEGE 07179 TaxID=945734 RepID=A0A563VTG6_9CYAN|nr:putative membrane transporter protein [Hyella patelloides LEGE 07179]
MLTLGSFISWLISTVAGGGTPFIMIPLIGFFLGSVAIPPVLTTVMLCGHPQRLWLYWKYIDWRIMGWYLPGAVVGAVLGAIAYTRIRLEWLPILLAVFLIISTFSYSPNNQSLKPAFKVYPWYFLPSGFVFAFLSGTIGSAGPLLNPLYINYGLLKEDLIGTKSAHLLVVHIVKIITYAIYGALNPIYLGYGLLMGLAAFPGNWLGQKMLMRMSEQNFQKLLVSFVFLTSLLIFWEQRELLVSWH